MGPVKSNQWIMSLSDSEKDFKDSDTGDQTCSCSSSTISSNALQVAQETNQKDENSPPEALKIKVSVQEFKVDNGEEEDEPRTPTSPEHKIPVMTSCPGAPRKPRLSPMAMKRKAQEPGFRGIVITKEQIDKLFRMVVPDILAADFGADDQVKKAKKAHDEP